MIERTREIEREAADWIVRIEGADGDADLQAARDAWLAQSPLHQVIYIRMAWGLRRAPRLMRSEVGHAESNAMTDEARERCEYSSTTAARRPLEYKRSLKRFGYVNASATKRIARAAACVLASIGAVWLARCPLLRNEAVVVYDSASHSDARGAKPILLSDGSRINLGRASKVEVRFSRSHRTVRLINGDARFTVAHDPKRVFEVIAGNVVTRDLATRFTVRLNADENVEVGVEEGRVLVDCGRGRGESGSPRRSDCSSLLNAGDRAEIRGGHLEVSKAMPESQAPRASGAQDGSAQSASLAFSGETLDEAVARVNQYSDRQLRVVDPRITKLTLGGVFKPHDHLVRDFVGALRLLGVSAQISEQNPQEIHLMREGCVCIADSSPSTGKADFDDQTDEHRSRHLLTQRHD